MYNMHRDAWEGDYNLAFYGQEDRVWILGIYLGWALIMNSWSQPKHV